MRNQSIKKSKYRLTYVNKDSGKIYTSYTNLKEDVDDEIRYIKSLSKYRTGTVSYLNSKTNKYRKILRIGWKRKQY